MFLQMQGARASLACPCTFSMQVRGAIVSGYRAYELLPVLYRILPGLYRYSKVWACNWQEETSQVVLKAYFKSKMRPRHLENVRRELDILGDLCNLRYIVARILCAQCLTQFMSPKGLGQAWQHAMAIFYTTHSKACCCIQRDLRH